MKQQHCKKIRYEVDPHNRLISSQAGRKTEVAKYRSILDGQFHINKNNVLIYHIKKSDDLTQPQQIKFAGTWSLDSEHNLILTLDKWGNQCQGNRLILKGEFLDAQSNELSFCVTTKDSQDKEHISILRLTGGWQADEYNRLTFNVEKEKGPADKLTLQGIWDINKDSQIVYTCTRSFLKTKEKAVRQLTFNGYWDISRKNRISYILNQQLGSLFEFKVAFEKANEKSLQYRIGIGMVPEKRTITLFGTWNISKKIGVLFEIRREAKQTQSIVFGASCRLDEKYNLCLELKNKYHQDLNIEVKLSKDIFEKQGEAFIKTLISNREMALFAGSGFRW